MGVINTKTNKVIWMYWHQGFDLAPEVVQHCVKKWQLLHEDWTIHFLNNKNVFNFIDNLPISEYKLNQLQLAHRSDLIRTQLLIKHGGVWADPTCYPMIPLDDWLDVNMQSGLFLFYKPGRDRIISNWFMAAKKGNPILEKLLIELCQYWENNTFSNYNKKKIWYELWVKKVFNRSLITTNLWFTWFTRKVLKIYPYMIYHYKFYQVISRDKKCKKLWVNMPKVSALEPHKLQRAGLLLPITEQTKELIESKKIPLFKLTWKINAKTWTSDSVLGYLFNDN